jgi:uncharacterized protein (TIGR02594 family)
MTTYNAQIIAAAGAYLGLEEWPGARNNPAILQMFSDVGHDNVTTDSTPWCAAFVGSVLGSLGLPHTRSLTARSYLDYGMPIDPLQAREGDIVVLWRNSPSSWQGHVGFFVRFEGQDVILRGGNQGNKVSDRPYPVSRILGIRRADGVVAGPSRPVLRSGERGAFVLDLQDQLAGLRYFAGRKDGVFGPLTREAVLAFQADNDLTVDGIVGPQTWAKLQSAEPRPDRDVDVGDLRDRGSRTVADADQGQAVTAVGGLIAGGGMIVTTLEQAADAVERAHGPLSAALALIWAYWPVIAVAVLAFAVWRYFGHIKAVRVEDARSGRHVGR